MQLDELLVTSGLLTDGSLELARSRQQETKRRLGETLIEMGFITEKALAEVLEFQLGYPLVELCNYSVDPEAVRLLPQDAARKYGAIAINKEADKLKVAMIEPLNFAVLEQMRLITGMDVQPMIGLRSDIEQALNKYYGMESQLDDWLEDNTEPQILEQAELHTADSPMIRMVNQFILSAANLRASDIHIEPQEKSVVIRYRIDGQLRRERELPKSMQSALITRIKIIAKLNIAERRLPQDGNIQFELDSGRLDMRVSILPTVYGESVVLRLMHAAAGVKKLHDLGFSTWNLQSFERCIRRPNGIILISGPTGSGKTSTLYSVLHEMKSEAVKIITTEDPVEFRMGGISQIQVNTGIGMTFASTLRTILRQDPDVVMVGEIRDSETAEIAVRASLTGHLVLSTIHTNNAVSTLNRLADMGIERYLIASSLACITAQRLVRTNCPNCSVETEATAEEKQLLCSKGMIAEQALPQLRLMKGQGCGSCGYTGYQGRMGIHEVLVIDQEIRSFMTSAEQLAGLEQSLRGKGYRTMLDDGLFKVLEGKTTVQEVLRAAFSE